MTDDTKERWNHMTSIIARFELARAGILHVNRKERRQLLDALWAYLEEMNDELPSTNDQGE